MTMNGTLSSSACILALLFFLGGVSASTNNSTSVLEHSASGLRGVTTTSTRKLQVTGEITGAFDVAVLARFNDVANGNYQRVFDFGNGPRQDNVWLGQVGNTNDMAFEIWVGDKFTRCVAPGAIVQGELATWKAGVDRNGNQWVRKNGIRICNIQGQVPRNVIRANKLLGQSNWEADTPLKGAVIGIDFTNFGEVRDGGLLNKQRQITGAFVITVQARFDAPQGGYWQRVFDFGNGAGQDNVWFGQLANTNDMVLEIWRAGVASRLVAPGALVTGQLATWKVGVDTNGLMWIEKAGIRIAQSQGTVPAAIQRNFNLVGSSNWGVDAPLDGVVLGLTVSSRASVPVPAPVSVPVPVPVPLPTPSSSAVLFAIVVNNYEDPLFKGLSIPPNAAQAGMWSGIINWPIVPIHAAVMIDGRVVTYGSPTGSGVQDGRTFTFWNPKLGTNGNSLMTSPNVQDVDSFCSSGQILPSGKLLIAGGASFASGLSGRGCTIVDPVTSTPVRAANLNLQRWYASLTSLPDGRQLITGGGSPYAGGTYPGQGSPNGVVANTPEVYTDGQGWTFLTGAKSDDAFGFPGNHWWYPRQWVTPTGSVFGISTEKMWEMQTTGTGTIRTIGNFKTAPNSNDRTLFPNTGPTSTGVMYDAGKIIQVGGNGYYNGYPSQSSNAATTFDINNISTGSVKVTETAPMTYGRQWANTAVLPNGNVLVTGGSKFGENAGTDAVLAAETWDPTTGTWTVRASAAIHRGYHSTAVLLPNGAVFTGGGGVPGPVTNFNAEIYYPPYFFKAQNGVSILANRPTIISLSNNRASYGDTIQIQYATGDIVSAVSFIALPSVTHGFDSNMRRIKLTFQTGADGTINVNMPSSANIAPPGYYYLSLVNEVGVPSLAVIIGMNAVAPPR